MIQHLATREQLEKLRGDLLENLSAFKVDLLKTLWITQLSTVGLVLIGVGLLIHFKP